MKIRTRKPPFYTFTQKRIDLFAEEVARAWLQDQRYAHSRGYPLKKLSSATSEDGQRWLSLFVTFNAFNDANGQKAWLRIREQAVAFIMYRVKNIPEKYSDILVMFPPVRSL